MKNLLRFLFRFRKKRKPLHARPRVPLPPPSNVQLIVFAERMSKQLAGPDSPRISDELAQSIDDLRFSMEAQKLSSIHDRAKSHFMLQQARERLIDLLKMLRFTGVR